MAPAAGDPVWRAEVPREQLAVIVALELEAAILRRALGRACSPLFVSGPGLERAREAAQRAVASGARALIGWGLAGGVNATAVTGSVLLPRLLLAGEGSWLTDPAWCERLALALGPDLPLLELPLYSAANVLTAPADKAALADATGAVAVDMESAAIAQVAAEASLPCVVPRAVADGPEDTLPANVEQLVTDSGRTRVRGLFRMLLAPGQLAALLRLGRNSQIARRTLRQVAARLRTAPA